MPAGIRGGIKLTDKLHPKYRKQLEEANKFEDFVTLKLYQVGVVIGLHKSMAYQRQGESRAGFEIKYDQKYQGTGNLFIETGERATATEGEPLKPSGIHANDNSWIYVIGDYHKLWVFGCKTLGHLQPKYKSAETKADNGVVTGKGFLMPVKDADKYAEKTISC